MYFFKGVIEHRTVVVTGVFDKNIFPDRGEMFQIESSAADLEADLQV